MALRVFLSSVTDRAASSDGKPDALRIWLDGELKKSSTHCVYQEFFIERGVNTLVKLAESIRSECEIVVHIVGNENGCQPSVGFVDELLNHCGEEAFRQTFREVFERDNALDRELLCQLTYTQWEAWLGHFYRKNVFIFLASAEVDTGMSFDSAERPSMRNGRHTQLIERYLGRPTPFATREDLLDSIKNALIRTFQSLLSQGNKFPWPHVHELLPYSLADRHEEFQHFLDIVSPTCPECILLIQGPSNLGKTTLIAEFQRQLSAVPDITCGRADFKGGIALNEVLHKLVGEITRAPLPTGDNSVTVDPSIASTFLRILGQSRNPIVLLLDTYEEATKQSQSWIETLLLPSVRRTEGVAIVIGGHFVPSRLDRLRDVAIVHELQPIDEVDDWIAYRDMIRAQRISDLQVAQLVTATAGNPGIIGPWLASQRESTDNGF